MNPGKKYNIIYIITQSAWGGAQRYVCDLAIYLHGQGWDVTVAFGENAEGELFQKLKAANVKTRFLKSLTRAVNPVKNIKAALEIRDLCRELKPDILHLNSSMAGVVGALGGKLSRVPRIIYTVHGLVTKEPLPAPLKGMYWFMEWLAGKFRDTTICVSEDDRRAVIRQHIAPSHRAVTIPIGIDQEIKFYSKEEARANLTQRIQEGTEINSAIIIGTIAGLYKTKGLDTLVRAAHQLQMNAAVMPPCKFIIIGEGPERSNLETKIKKYDLTRIVFLAGNIPDAARYLKAFDLFVLPSVKEGMPYTILEALDAGIPIIATLIGGMPEVLHEDGWHALIPPDDPQALSLAIQKIIGRGFVYPLPPTLSPTNKVSDMLQKTIELYSAILPV